MQISRQLHLRFPESGDRHHRCRRGATTLETALVVGTWTMVFVGIFDAGVTTMRSNTAAHLARQAARMTIVRGSQAGPELPVWGPTTRTVNLADASEISRTLAPHTRGLNAAAFTLKLEWLDGNNDPDSRVRATVSSAYHPVITQLTGLGSVPMQAQCTMSIVH
ncbi:MAG: TadE/TadG family type IV pilus assembly protein [Planctomycetaceae bacterium]|jgi:Flp pilus assembly protein TadG